MPLGSFRLNAISRVLAAAFPRTQKTFTAFGNAQISTAASVFGGASGLFDGAGDYLRTNNFLDNALMNSGDFTMEFWAKFDIMPATQTGGGGSYMCFFFSRTGDSSGPTEPYILVKNNASNQPVIEYGIKRASSSIYGNWTHTGKTITTNTWYHIAVVKSGGVWKAYWDGSLMTGQSGTVPLSTDVPLYYPRFDIGGFVAVNRGYWDGNIDEVRFSNTARYTSNFTVPTSEFAHDEYTTLLLHMNGTNGSTVFTDSIS